MKTLDNLFGGGRTVEPNTVARRDAKPTQKQIRESQDPDSDSKVSSSSDADNRLSELEQRLEQAEKRLRDKDSHIGKVEAEARAWRETAESLRDREPAHNYEPESNPFDDPETQEYLKQIADQPDKLARVISEYAEAKAQERLDSQIGPVRQTLETMVRMQSLQQQLRAELNQAKSLGPAAAQLVQEAEASNFTSGPLVEAIRENPRAVTVPGGAMNLVGRLAASMKDSSEPSNYTPNRPKAQTRTLNDDGPTLEDEDKELKDRIVNATLGSRLPFQSGR